LEAALIARIRTGNINVFETIVEKYQFPLVRYLYRLTGDYELAKDLTQDTFIKAYRSILKTDSELNLNAWLFRIATNTAIQHLRRKKIISFIPFDNLSQPENKIIGTQTDTQMDELAIKETFEKIPWDQRVCMVLHYVEGFKYREIADTLEISEDAVRKRVSRGVQLFRRLYNGGKGR
jgi:RNA polymerase sigma-70 factor (ECF subfamily)